MFTPCPTERSRDIADRVERFVRDVVAPYESDPRCGPHGPSADLVDELRAKYGDDLNVGTIVVLPSPDETHPNVLIKAKDCSFDESAVELTW